jgi:hypothetical protein
MHSVFLGSCLHVRLRLPDGGEAVAEVTRWEETFRAGESVYAFWGHADEMVFP